ncbi:MAG: transposase, partial [Rhodobacteraceae bacterium]|nr:transposase [Paracoccaceae bacterium]
APRGERPVARGHHRFEWLYVSAFVSPATGESFWYLSTGVDKDLFEDTLALFAREAGAGCDRIIILVLDGAGWHTEPLVVPEGIRLVFLPPYTPELQPGRDPLGPRRRTNRQQALRHPRRPRRRHC